MEQVSAHTARAEANRRVAAQQRDEADEAAEEATARVEEMARKAAQATAGQAAAAAEFTAAQQRHLGEIGMLNNELAADRRDTAHQQERADGADRIVNEQAIRLVALTTELAGARQSHLEQVEQSNAQLAGTRADTAAQQLRAENAERNVGEATVRAATPTAELGSPSSAWRTNASTPRTAWPTNASPSRTASPICGPKWSNSRARWTGRPTSAPSGS